MTFAVAVLIAVLAAVAVTLAYTWRTGISPVPTTPRVRRAMFALLPQDIDGAIYELGAGWGGLALAIARRYGGNRVVAVELSPLPWLVLAVRAALSGAPNLEIRRADFHALSLGDAGLVACYLCPMGMAALEAKLTRELRPGALVVSNSFALPGRRPAAVRRAEDQYRSPVYLWNW